MYSYLVLCLFIKQAFMTRLFFFTTTNGNVWHIMDRCYNSKKACIKDYKELIRKRVWKITYFKLHLYFYYLNNVFGIDWLGIKLNWR